MQRRRKADAVGRIREHAGRARGHKLRDDLRKGAVVIHLHGRKGELAGGKRHDGRELCRADVIKRRRNASISTCTPFSLVGKVAVVAMSPAPMEALGARFVPFSTRSSPGDKPSVNGA